MAKQYEAVIFDLDGVICSTDEYHYMAWKAIADSLGIPFDDSINNRLRGVSRMDSLEIILEYSSCSLSTSEKENLANQKNSLYRQYLQNMSPADLDCDVKKTLEAIRQADIKIAIGSSSKNARFILKQLGLDGYFDAVCDGNDITKSKPNPEVFIKAAQMLHISNEKCLVIEDALAGAEAARLAGMDLACLGDASISKAGDYNLDSFAQLSFLIDV